MESGNQDRSQPTRRELEGLKVLIAEDEAMVAMGLADIVEDEGGEVVGPYAKCAECLDYIERELPDLAILDLRLSDGESLPVAEKLAESGIPIVFHSGHMLDEEWRSSRGMVLYCGKPCPQSEMQEALLKAAQSR